MSLFKNKKVKKLENKLYKIYDRLYDVERDIYDMKNVGILVNIEGEKDAKKELKLPEAIRLIGSYLKLNYEKEKLVNKSKK